MKGAGGRAGMGVQIDPSPGKTTLKKHTLIRVKTRKTSKSWKVK